MTMRDGAGDDPFADDPEPEPEPQTEQTPDEDSMTSPTLTVEDEADSDEEQDRIERLADILEEIENGERPKTVGFRDDVTMALLVALDEDEELRDDLAQGVSGTLDREVDPDALDRSEAARLLIRAGLQNVAPEVLSDLGEARGEVAKRSL
jgi:hypothetical protein